MKKMKRRSTVRRCGGSAAAESVKRGIPLRDVKVETLRLFDGE